MPRQHRTRLAGCQADAPFNRSRSRLATFHRGASVPLSLLLASSLGSPAVAQDRDLLTEHHVHVSARRAGSGDAVSIGIRIDPGYHIYANPPSNDYLIPTTVRFTGAMPVGIDYPAGMDFKPAFTDEPFRVYEGTALITATFEPGILGRARSLEATVTAQACTDRICLQPADIPVRVEGMR